MAPRKKSRPRRLEDSIAFRTRIQRGSTMHKTKPVQHPHNWPLLQELERDAMKKRSKTKKATRYNRSVSRARLHRSRARNKKPQRSLVQVVRHRDTGKKVGYKKVVIQSRRYSRQAQSKYRNGRKTTTKRYARKTRRPRRIQRRQGNRKYMYKRKPKRYYRRRPRAKRCAGPRPVRRQRQPIIRPEIERSKMKPVFNVYDEYDRALGPQPTNIPLSPDVGMDEIRDDPLNIGNLCRSFVQGLVGVIPADNRNSKIAPKLRTLNFRLSDDKPKRNASEHEELEEENSETEPPNFPPYTRFKLMKKDSSSSIN